ncbi:MAG: response regulator [Syntrophobacteraceae bacterium]
MPKEKLLILMADDDYEDRMFVQEALKGKPVKVKSVVDGMELLDYLLCRGKYKHDGKRRPRPDLILLDLNMPKMGGKEALAEIRSDSFLRSIPVVILTTSREECEVQRCYDLGANTYIVKPLSFQKLVEIMHSLHLYWADLAQLPVHVIPPTCA